MQETYSGYLKTKIAAMFFLEYFVLLTMSVPISLYFRSLGLDHYIYLIFLIPPVAVFLTSIFSGVIADKYFPAQKVLGVAYLLAGSFELLFVFIGSSPLILLFTIGFFLMMMPTISLSNSIALKLLVGNKKHFMRLRIFGTFGWLGSSFVISFLNGDSTWIPYVLGAGGAFVAAILSFRLPTIPPLGLKNKISLKILLGAEAFVEMKQSYKAFIFFSASISFIYMALSSYSPLYLEALEVKNVTATMAWAQASEVFILIAIAFFMKHLSPKTIFLLAAISIFIRVLVMLLYSFFFNYTLLAFGLATHGFYVAFFMIYAQAFIHSIASEKIVHQAQSFLLLVTLGAGSLLGALFGGALYNILILNNNNIEQWQYFWSIMLFFSFLMVASFWFTFKNPKITEI